MQQWHPRAPVSGENLNCPLPLQPMPSDQQTDLPHLQSRNFPTAVCSLGLGTNWTACKHSNRGISVSYRTLEPPDISSVGFPSQTFKGLLFPVQVPEVRVPDVEHQPFTPSGEAPVCGNLYFVSMSWHGVFYKTVPLSVLSSSVRSFYPLLWRSSSSSFKIFSREQ